MHLCKPTYQAQAWSAHTNKRVRRTFKTLTAARTGRQEAAVALRRREMNVSNRSGEAAGWPRRAQA